MKLQILSSIADGIIALDSECVVRYVNTTMCQLLEGNEASIVGKPFDTFLSETELLGMLGVEDAIQDGEPTWLQVVFKGNKGHYLPLSVTLSAMPDNDGQNAGYVMVCRSQSEIRELLIESSRLAAVEVERRVELQRAKDAAERREQHQLEVGHAEKLESIGQLAAGIAHEINTPIQFIGDNVVFLKRAFGMLVNLVAVAKQVRDTESDIPDEFRSAMRKALRKAKVDYLSEEVPRAIEQTIDGVHRVATIVKAMKDVSHPSSGERQEIDLHRAIDSTITVARNEWKYVAELEKDFDPDLPMVPCFPDEISQVILNIVINAAHAIGDVAHDESGPLGRICIATKHDAQDVEIRISDTGTGMPPELVQRIFDPFFTTKEVGKGTGQGLALSYHVVVKRHGGTIDVETVPNEGTTFVVRLPLDPTTRASAPDGAPLCTNANPEGQPPRTREGTG